MRWRSAEAAGSPAARAILPLALGFGLVAAGCTTTLGTVPRIAARDASQGFKMLKPGATVTACSEGFERRSADPPLELAFRRLMAQDEEANAILDTQIRSTSWSIGVYASSCVTLTGDLVRSTSTVLLPMGETHGQHSGH